MKRGVRLILVAILEVGVVMYFDGKWKSKWHQMEALWVQGCFRFDILWGFQRICFSNCVWVRTNRPTIRKQSVTSADKVKQMTFGRGRRERRCAGGEKEEGVDRIFNQCSKAFEGCHPTHRPQVLSHMCLNNI